MNRQFYSPVLTAATAIVAVIVGFAIAFFDMTPENQPVLFWIGVGITAAMFIAFLVVPTIKMLVQRGGHGEASES